MRDNYLSVNGEKIYYKVIGEGEPLLFIHGGPGLVHNYFLPHFRQLVNSGYQLIFYDQRGNGKSFMSPKEEYINLETFTLDIEELRKELNIEKINLFGHSMGGFFAIDYAVKFPEHVNKLIVSNCVPFQLNMLETMSKNRNERMGRDFQEAMKIQNSEDFKSYDPEAFNKYMLLMEKSNFYDRSSRIDVFSNLGFKSKNIRNFLIINRRLLREYTKITVDYNLNKIKNPTLVLHCDNDFIPLEASEFIANEIQMGKLKVIDNCGHYPFIEKTDEICEIIEGFLK